jgi:hypothetical protein
LPIKPTLLTTLTTQLAEEATEPLPLEWNIYSWPRQLLFGGRRTYNNHFRPSYTR